MGFKLSDDIREIKQKVPDETLRHIAFANDDDEDNDLFLTQLNEIYRYFNNIMEIAFFFVYGRYKQWQKAGNRYLEYTPEKGTKNFNRIVSLFEQLYCVKDLKPDNISDVLIDLQIDITKSNSDEIIEGNEELYQALNDFFLKYDVARSASYSECDYLAKQYVTTSYVDDPLRGEGSNVLAIRRSTLIELLGLTFPFFMNLSAKIVPINGLKLLRKENGKVEVSNSTQLKEIKFLYRNPGQTTTRLQYQLPNEIPLNMTLVASPRYYYYLERIDKYIPPKRNNKPITVLNYIRMANSPFTHSIYVLRSDDNYEDLPDDSLFIQDDDLAAMINNVYFAFERKASKSKSMVKDFTTINYKYIKKLALALCDTLSYDAKRHLYKKYGKEHPELFNNNDPSNKDSYSISEQEIDKIDWDSSVAVLLVDEGATMVLRTIMLAEKDGDKFFSSLCSNLQARLGENVFSGAKVVLGAKKEWKTLKEKRDKYSRIDMIPSEIRSDFDNEETFIKAEVSTVYLIDELARIEGSSKPQAHYTFPVSIVARCKLLDKIKTSYLSAQQKVEGLVNLANQTMIQLIAFYEGFFRYAYEVKSFHYQTRFTKHAIKSLQENANKAFAEGFYETYEKLNKKENYNSESIFQEINRLNKETSRPDSKNPVINNKYVYTKYFLGRKSFVDIRAFEAYRTLSQATADEYDEALYIVQCLFNYLKTGCVNESDKKGDETAIFPYIATHLFEHESRDGFVIKHFEVLVEDGTEHDIKVLSDFDYSINHRYYCLPSSLRYNSNIDVWIEPILIDYNLFEQEQ